MDLKEPASKRRKVATKRVRWANQHGKTSGQERKTLVHTQNGTPWNPVTHIEQHTRKKKQYRNGTNIEEEILYRRMSAALENETYRPEYKRLVSHVLQNAIPFRVFKGMYKRATAYAASAPEPDRAKVRDKAIGDAIWNFVR
jgi:hypothetical protein